MGRNEQIDQILEIHQTMADLLRRAELSEKSYLHPVKDIGLFDDSEINELWLWITRINQNEYKELHRIFKMPADDSVWDRYILLKVEGLPEQALFAKAALNLRKAWHKCYRPNRRFRNAAGKTGNERDSGPDSVHLGGVQVQSEGARAIASDCGSP